MVTRAALMAQMSADMGPIGCNGCTACCWHDRVPLTESEAHDFPHERDAAGPHLAKRADGACVLLGDGCTVHGRAPGICQRMDCRVLVRITSPEQRAQRARDNPQMALIYNAGVERLQALEA